MFVTWQFICVILVVSLTRLDVSTATGRVRLSLHGSGASFPARLYMEWAAAFKAYRSPNVQLSMTYDSVGSGQGLAMLLDDRQTVHYAGSDALLANETYAKHDDLQMFPTCAG